MSGAPQRLVLRNTLFLVGAQVVAAPLAILVNAVAARVLGPAGFGQIYLATTFASLAILIVEWGQPGCLTAWVARDRSRAGELLGSGLALRALLLPMVLAALALFCLAAGYDRGFIAVLALVLLSSVFGTVCSASQDVIRGFERSDVVGGTVVAWQLLGALVLVPTLLVFGSLHSFLLAQAACAATAALVLVLLLRGLGVRGIRVRRQTGRELFLGGTSFLVFNVVLVLQPNVDAVFLSKLASPEAIGWQAVARKLTGLLILPASALSAALYPTLSRLYTEDRVAFRAAAAGALRVTPAFAVPLALCGALFPEIGIDLFGRSGYGESAINIRLLSAFVLLLYLTMPLSTTLLAAGRQRAWAAAQFGCVILSSVLDPLLIPWFQTRTGNGGIGVCVATVVAEFLMVAAGLYLLPRDIFDRTYWRSFGSIAAAAAAMVLVSLALSGWSPYAVAPVGLIAYVACLWLTGALDRTQVEYLVSLLKRRRTE
jgi:O-antigen/teichoic acid export membrane protein